MIKNYDGDSSQHKKVAESREWWKPVRVLVDKNHSGVSGLKFQ